MSQIDKVAYLPLLFWFIILFSLFYVFIYAYFLKFILIAFNTRNRLFNELVNFSINAYALVILFNFFLDQFVSLFNMLYSFLYVERLVKINLIASYKIKKNIR